MNCPHCNYAGVPDGARFCPNCGERITQSAGATTTIAVEQKIGTLQGGQATGVEIDQLVGNVIIAADEERQARRRRNLRVLLNKVKRYWVSGVLEQSLDGATLIELGKQSRAAAVQHPLDSINPSIEHADRELPAETSFVEIFDKVDYALLVLDGLGSGKTTSLLVLARDIVRQAEQDPTQPVPVVLNLSSWTSRQTIADWVINELAVKYQIPRTMSREWLENNELALLLDGLDEVTSNLRAECITALNLFRQEHGLIHIGVCTRSQEYDTAATKLSLAAAVMLAPLSDQQIVQYLATVGPKVASLQEALKEDAQLQLLARSPLMLYLMCQAYRGVPVESLRGQELDTLEARRARIINAFVERTYSRAPGQKLQARQQIDSRLSWLARGMAGHGQSIFLLEQLQPSWIASSAQRWLYWLISRMIVGLFVSLVLAGTAEVGGTPLGRSAYVLTSILVGFVIGLIDRFRWEREQRKSAISRSSWGTPALYALCIGLVAGLLFYLVFGLGLGLGSDGWRLAGGALLVYGVVFGLAEHSQGPEDIQPAEALTWSWAEAGKSLLPGVLVGTATVVVIGILFSTSNPLNVWLTFGLVFGVLVLGGLFLVFGLRGRKVERTSFPNQGIWMSARNAIQVALLFGIGAGTLYGFVYGVLPGSVVGLRVGVLFLLLYGGYAVIKHITLRMLLRVGERIPWRLAAFLEYAATLGFLQRVGGGYLFLNRLLHEHFASMVLNQP